ncbi:hypothetical protein ACP70R_041654 [Stipagrostis hirtigluma subsp. patula]
MQFRLAPWRRRAAPGAPQGSGGRRRKRVAVARLGGGGGDGNRRFFGALRLRLRVPWLAALCRRTQRQLRACCAQVLRDLVEGTALVGALHAPAGIDCAHAAPFGPIATAGF